MISIQLEYQCQEKAENEQEFTLPGKVFRVPPSYTFKRQTDTQKHIWIEWAC